MRNSLNPNDDLWYALDYNSPSTFTVEEVKSIVAEVPGENDELSWWWILKLGTKRFILVSGWCDYTGWDCQSGIEEFEITTTPLRAAKMAPIKESKWSYDRNIKQNLINQLKGIQPFGTEIR